MTERNSTDEPGVGVLCFPNGNMQGFSSKHLGKSNSKHREPWASQPGAGMLTTIPHFCLPVDASIIKGHRLKTPSFKQMRNGMHFPFLQESCALDPFNLHEWLQRYQCCLPRTEPQQGSMLEISERYWINGSTLQNTTNTEQNWGR